MDLEDEGWVNIPYDELLEVHDYGDGKIFSREHVKSPPAKLLKPIYFDTPENSKDFLEDESRVENHEEEVKEIIKLPILINGSYKETTPESDQDPIYQVFPKKENQFVELKTVSPSRETDMSHTETGSFQYEEKSGDHVVNCSSPSKMIKKEVGAWENYDQKFNFWKWGLSGIGAFCSLGMTAATIGIIILGNGRRHKQQNQKLRIQIYSDNKGIKNAVQQANEAMSAMRGAPLVKDHITYGGYYESL